MAAITDLLPESAIRLTERAADRFEAVRLTGEALVALGAARPQYVESMLDRERSVSTYIGEGVAVPHGTLAGKEHVLADALVLLKFPDGVDWNGERVVLCVGIAAAGSGHIAMLSRIADVLLDADRAAALRAADTTDEVLSLLAERPGPGRD
jgi:mannitol PTS system EIIA component